jgi:hypothetical protein
VQSAEFDGSSLVASSDGESGAHCMLATSSAGKSRCQFDSGSRAQFHATLLDRLGDAIGDAERVIVVRSRDEKDAVGNTSARVFLLAVESR